MKLILEFRDNRSNYFDKKLPPGSWASMGQIRKAFDILKPFSNKQIQCMFKDDIFVLYEHHHELSFQHIYREIDSNLSAYDSEYIEDLEFILPIPTSHPVQYFSKNSLTIEDSYKALIALHDHHQASFSEIVYGKRSKPKNEAYFAVLALASFDLYLKSAVSANNSLEEDDIESFLWHSEQASWRLFEGIEIKEKAEQAALNEWAKEKWNNHYANDLAEKLSEHEAQNKAAQIETSKKGAYERVNKHITPLKNVCFDELARLRKQQPEIDIETAAELISPKVLEYARKHKIRHSSERSIRTLKSWLAASF